MRSLSEANFDVALADHPLLLVDFFATWCPPCAALTPILEAAAKEMPEVEFAKVNTSEQVELADRFSISSIPALIFFKDGKEVKRIVGLTTGAVIKETFAEIG